MLFPCPQRIKERNYNSNTSLLDKCPGKEVSSVVITNCFESLLDYKTDKADNFEQPRGAALNVRGIEGSHHQDSVQVPMKRFNPQGSSGKTRTLNQLTNSSLGQTQGLMCVLLKITS